ncbi:hypothetical protein FA15DRAFT_718027 [Coprinopsis marcescibilis]|uniref:SnoaL-like domain-containing protein n=1 Tax=Coprinopsis marcescibilis TaxID=230819 RepID=A0A5C3KLK5_COPMA|nr:hypothetical protein FA15DRAFT_718027 [Coprinopsis marcescibilis]
MKFDLFKDVKVTASPADYEAALVWVQRVMQAIESKSLDALLDCFLDTAVVKFCHLPATAPTRESKALFVEWCYKFCKSFEFSPRNVAVTDTQIILQYMLELAFEDGSADSLELVTTYQRNLDTPSSNKMSHVSIAGDLSRVHLKLVKYAGPPVW